MVEKQCIVCKRDFSGRKNQVFCSLECKNRHYNQKTRLIYVAGKSEAGAIAKIQDQLYDQQQRIKKASVSFDETKEWYRDENAKMKTEFEVLLEKYQKVKTDLDKLKEKTVYALKNAQELEQQLKLIEIVGQAVAPAIKKLFNLISKTDEGSKPEKD